MGTRKKKQAPSIAYEDLNFLRSPLCRGIRLELEYMKPAAAMNAQNIDSTVIIFGSARIKSPENAEMCLKEAAAALKQHPRSAQAKDAMAKAKKDAHLAKYYDDARILAGLITEYSLKHKAKGHRFAITTGGGPGIMEAANRGASEKGGKSIGLCITLPFEETSNPYISEQLEFRFHYFCIRKLHFISRAQACICFPGGFGTMDELFEIITLIQTKIMPRIPLVLYGSEYWKQTINWQAFIDAGMISPNDLELFKFCDTPQDAWEEIRKFYGLRK